MRSLRRRQWVQCYAHLSDDDAFYLFLQKQKIASFQDHCALPDPSKDSWPALERRLLEAKSHLLALRPADAEAVTDFMIAMQLHTFIKQGTLLPDEKYREAYRLVLDGVEQELDAPGQLGPLSLPKMKEVGAQL